jgi:hypothetical protein
MKKLAPNKATNDLNWETGKAWTSLSIDSPWQLGSVQDRSFLSTHYNLVGFAKPMDFKPPKNINNNILRTL